MIDDRTTMRDGGMPLLDRIDAAIRRVTKGEGQMRVPAEATGLDIVLFDCRGRIVELETEIERLRELARDAERYRHLRDAKIDDWSRDFVAACLCDQGGDMTEVKGEALDAAVDAAIDEASAKEASE